MFDHFLSADEIKEKIDGIGRKLADDIWNRFKRRKRVSTAEIRDKIRGVGNARKASLDKHILSLYSDFLKSYE